MANFVEKQIQVVNQTWSQIKPFSRKLNRDKVVAILNPMYSTAYAEGYGHGKAEMCRELRQHVADVKTKLESIFATDEPSKNLITDIFNQLENELLPW